MVWVLGVRLGTGMDLHTMDMDTHTTDTTVATATHPTGTGKPPIYSGSLAPCFFCKRERKDDFVYGYWLKLFGE